MTFHILLPTADFGALAWITDTSAVFGRGNKSAIKKITYSEQHRFAYSSWGDFNTAYVADKFADRVKAGAVELSNPDMVASSLTTSAEEVLAQLSKPTRERRSEQQGGHGVILATFQQPMRLYEAHIGAFPIVREATGEIMGGDLYNPARIFVEHYYRLSGKSIRECLNIGIHTVRLARAVNTLSIGDTIAWVYDEGRFRQLADEEMKLHLNISKAIDESILGTIRTRSTKA